MPSFTPFRKSPTSKRKFAGLMRSGEPPPQPPQPPPTSTPQQAQPLPSRNQREPMARFTTNQIASLQDVSAEEVQRITKQFGIRPVGYAGGEYLYSSSATNEISEAFKRVCIRQEQIVVE